MPKFSEVVSKADISVLKEKFQILCHKIMEIDEENKIDVNIHIKKFKKNEMININQFLENTVNLYFTSPSVISCLRYGDVTIYPNARTLRDINYELLEKVYQLGQ